MIFLSLILCSLRDLARFSKNNETKKLIPLDLQALLLRFYLLIENLIKLLGLYLLAPDRIQFLIRQLVIASRMCLSLIFAISPSIRFICLSNARRSYLSLSLPSSYSFFHLSFSLLSSGIACTSFMLNRSPPSPFTLYSLTSYFLHLHIPVRGNLRDLVVS